MRPDDEPVDVDPEPELRGDRPQRRDDEGDVLVEVDAELLGAAVDLVTMDAGGEGGLLQLLAGTDFGSSVPRCRRAERSRTRRRSRPARRRRTASSSEGVSRGICKVFRVRENAVDQLVGVALLTQDRRAVLRVLVERWMDLVVEVVQQRSAAPELLVLPEPPGVGADRAPRPPSAWRRSGSLCVYRVSVCHALSRVTSIGSPRISDRLVGLERGGSDRWATMAGFRGAPPCQPSYPLPSSLKASCSRSSSTGGHPLSGGCGLRATTRAALPIIAACLLTEEPVTLTNVPSILDVETMLELVEHVGAGRRATGLG